MSKLTAKTLSVVEKDTGRRITVGLEGFPYTLIWSAVGNPELHFVCIEPWQSTPSPAEGGNLWEEKPAAAVLQPGETYETCLKTTFSGV